MIMPPRKAPSVRERPNKPVAEAVTSTIRSAVTVKISSFLDFARNRKIGPIRYRPITMAAAKAASAFRTAAPIAGPSAVSP